jgi:hypothetical protein
VAAEHSSLGAIGRASLAASEIMSPNLIETSQRDGV